MAEPEPASLHRHEGYLHKKRPHLGLGLWQKRWVVLEGQTLSYYKAREDAALHSEPDRAHSVTSVRTEDGYDDGRFVITTDGGRNFTFCPEGVSELPGWLSAIDAALSRGTLSLCRATTSAAAVRPRHTHLARPAPQ